MKTTSLFPTVLLTFCFFLLTLFSFAQWELQYPKPTDNDLEDVCFVDDLNGWAVGENGTIIHTNNGGVSWDFQESGTLFSLRSVVFKDLQTGWIVGGETHPIPGDYIILHTTDGGNNWIDQDSDSTACMRSVFFIDSGIGWAVGDRGTLLYTGNGGIEWVSQWSGSPSIDFNEVYFVDSLNGWIASESGLYKTTDGGLNWNDQITTGNFLSVYFINQYEGWASTGGMVSRILNTTNAFNTWDTVSSYSGVIIPGELSYHGRYSIYFKDISNGWILYSSYSGGGWYCPVNYDLQKTTDGGISWESIELPTSLLCLNSIHFVPEGSGSLVGNHGMIYKSYDWSDQWEQQSQGNISHFNSVCFLDELNGWAVGYKSLFNYWGETVSAIVHTSDGGTTWTKQNSNISGRLQSVSFIDLNTGWAVGNSNDTNFIINTTNGGEEWLIQRWDTDCFLNEVCFLDESFGWAVGGFSDSYGNNEGRILKTGDGGNTWEQQDCDTCHVLNSAFFVDSDNGWVIGNSIYNTTDGGQSWTEQFYDTIGFTLESVFFTDIENGWIVGNKPYPGSGIILHTTDEGNSWSFELIEKIPFSVHFKDKDNGLISGSDGIILLTQDGGITWEQLDSGTDNSLYSIFYTNDGYGYATGAWGTIVHSDNLITSIDEFPDKSINFEVQCYPNPFSENTTLSYSLPQKSIVSFEIYNSKGQLVFKQKDEVKTEGQHYMVFDSMGLSTGIYLCVLKTSEGIQTTKIIIQ